MLIRLAKWYEWAFGTTLLTTIGVILSLRYLDGFSQWALTIGLLIFFVASLVKQFDDAKRLGK